MGFLLLAFVLVIVAEVFLIKFYYDGEKQLAKYDKEHSTVSVTSVEELVAKMRAIPNAGINQVDCDGNKVNLTCQSGKYIVNVENGIAAVEYDRCGCGLKLSSLSRILQLFKFTKAVNKAVEINTVMDGLSGKNNAEEEKEYKKVKADRNGLGISVLVMFVCLVIGLCSFFGGVEDAAVENVKAMEFYEGITYGELISGYIENPEWTVFNTETDTPIVEVNGTSVEEEEIRIQFSGEMGMGLNGVENQSFRLRYFGIDGESYDAEEVMWYVYEFLYYND